MIKRAIIFFFICFSAHGQTPAIFADLSDHLIAIHTGFKGADLVLFGASKIDHDIVVMIKGPNKNFSIKQKTRNYGLWMHGNQIEMPNIPSYFKLASTAPLENILTENDLVRHQLSLKTLALGLDEKFRTAFIDDMMKKNMFLEEPTSVDFIGTNLFRVKLNFPSDVPPGIYTVHVFLVKDKIITDAQSIPLHINKIGLSADIFALAHSEAYLYGLFTILCAIFFGTLAGFILKRR
jgi:uncharacterized protein (TIGR02186 family)